MEAATTTLADSLLDDLDDLDDLSVENEENEEHYQNEATNEGSSLSNSLNMNEEMNESSATVPKSARKRLLDDPALLACLAEIKEQSDKVNGDNNHNNNNNNKSDNDSSEQEQHNLILNCNRYLSALDTEMRTAHLELQQAYAPKFPELADLVVNPLQYKNAVSVIQNETDMTHIHDQLNTILNSNQILTISVAATTTSATQPTLSQSQLEKVNEACAYMDQVQDMIQQFTRYVESKMADLAPNTCALIGPTIAAILLGLSGGLAELSKIPACNLQVIGQVKHNSSSRAGMSSVGLSLHSKLHSKNNNDGTNNNGFEGGATLTSMSKQSLQPHTGVLYNCDLVQKCPAYLQKKALKTVASKLALVVRCDYVNVESGRKRTAENGWKFRSEIEAKILKWEEPDKARVLKALPKPDLTTKKRRGGKRMRRLKEKFAETELMKQANKRAFSTKVGEYGDDAMGLTLGMLDTKEASGGGAIKNQANLMSQAKKMKVANTKASRQNQNKRRAIQMSSGNTNGLASSMVFTPVQGLELVNPDAQRDRVREANAKWFSENTGFHSATSKKKPS